MKPHLCQAGKLQHTLLGGSAARQLKFCSLSHRWPQADVLYPLQTTRAEISTIVCPGQIGTSQLHPALIKQPLFTEETAFQSKTANYTEQTPQHFIKQDLVSLKKIPLTVKACCHFTVKKHFLLEANEKQPEGLSPKSNVKPLL